MNSRQFQVSVVALAIGLSWNVEARAQAQPVPRADPVPKTAQPDIATQGPQSVEDNPVTLPPGGARSTRRSPNQADAPQADIEVTGSRLATGDVTSNVQVITREEIRKRGVTSVEELIRTLPQNVATIGAITNERSRGPLTQDRQRQGAVSALGSFGVSAANLGGIGAGNTLVLVNGRRMAGAAGIEDGFVNLNGIPLSAIERVEISDAGSSAVYGADAIGGVINFILRRDYVGFTLGAQHEYSSNGADVTRINAYTGYAWSSGSISGTAAYDRRKPIINGKTGYVTENYADQFGGNSTYDRRSFTRGAQPGVIDVSELVFDPVTFVSTRIPRALTVPAGLTGPARRSDFVTVGSEALPDFVPEFAGPRTNTLSFTANIDQNITDRLKVFVNGLYSRAENTQQERFNTGLQLMPAPGQAYNPFPSYSFDAFTPGPRISYYPTSEIADGTLAGGDLRNVVTAWTVNAGATYDFGGKTRLNLLYTAAASRSSGDQFILGSVVTIQADPARQGAFRCYNRDLAEGRVAAQDLAYFQGVFDRQCQALTSADPALAFNPFKSTTGGGGSSVSDFYYKQLEERRRSVLQNYELRLNGTVLTLPAGDVAYVVGGEYNDDGVNSREVRNFTGDSVSRDRYAFFGEVNLPILGKDFDLPLIRSLTFNLAARHDVYLTEGAVGTVGGVRVDQGGEIVYDKNRFARTTPAFGLRWEPLSNLVAKARWTRGFQAPPYTDLFSVSGSQTFTTIINGDPLYTCTTDCNARGGLGYIVPLTTAPNPDLKPRTSRQQSFSATWQPAGDLSGLVASVTYNRTNIRNQYGRLSDLVALIGPVDIYRLESFYPRDAQGKITAARNLTFNMIGSKFASLTYELSYRIITRYGNFEPKLVVLDNLKAETQGRADTAPISFLGTVQGPDDYRIVGSLGWQYEDITAMLYAYHSPSYVNDYALNRSSGRILNPQDALKVASLTTFDLSVQWRPSQKLGLTFAGRNILDEKPPFTVIETRPYDTGRWNVAGRTLSLQVEYSF